MLRIDELDYSIQGRPLFESASAVIPEGHKVGLVGPNGAGKTTLFKIIRGELESDGGSISIPEKARIGGVAQEVPSSETTLLETVLQADTERLALLKEADTATDPNRIAEVHTRLIDIDAYSAEARAATILKGLGFDTTEQNMPCSAFSGGWRMRVALAAVLFSAPDVLLLDEPTNYLDLEGAVWLETYLAKYPHTVIIISHDRGLLNRAVGAILHLDERKLTYYTGTYDMFAKQRAEQRAVLAAAAKKQTARKDHLQKFVDRFRAKASKAKQAQARLKMIERMDPINSPEEAAKQVFTFPEPEELSPPIINLAGASVGYDGVAVLRGLDLRIDQDDRIALLGQNGQGKSTLSKLLSGRLEPLNGNMTVSRKLRIGYFAQHQIDELHPEDTPLQHLIPLRKGEHSSKLRARLASFGLGADQVETPVVKLSGGQKARLSLLLATLDAPHILILDEPTNHLDIESREALVEALTHYSGAVILVSHDMHLLNMVADRLWLVNDGKVTEYTDDLETYRRGILGTPNKTNKASKTAPAAKPKSKPKPKKNTDVLRAAVKDAESRVEKMEALSAKITATLADPKLYEQGRLEELQRWQAKQAELATALSRAEAIWEKAVATYEAAKAE